MLFSVRTWAMPRWIPIQALCAGMLLFATPMVRATELPAVSFSRDVQTVLNQNCINCHRPEKRKGKLDLTSFAAIQKGGKNGEVVVAGEPKASALVTMVTGDHPEM